MGPFDRQRFDPSWRHRSVSGIVWRHFGYLVWAWGSIMTLIVLAVLTIRYLIQ